jgi:predicted nucleic acid-binding protein
MGARWLAEAANAPWPKIARGELSPKGAEERVEALIHAPMIISPIGALMMRAHAISMAHSVTIYEPLNVALAEKRGVQLVTEHRRLIRRLARDAALAGHVVWPGDIAPEA